jgi:hypothetical protein
MEWREPMKLPYYNPEIRVEFDVDETLVRFDETGNIRVHKGHVEALKNHWRRGHHVKVHSKGGSLWARCIVDLLRLNKYVHEITNKTSWYYDDIPADQWKERVYLKQDDFNGGKHVGGYRANSECSEDSSVIRIGPHNSNWFDLLDTSDTVRRKSHKRSRDKGK